jgi:hypothetical protein
MDRIKEVTGVTDINEVLHKMDSQTEVLEILKELK